MILWRISNHATLDGVGGLKFSGRWHTKGRPIVYAADHPASALLEMLAHTDSALLPRSFQMLKIVLPPNAERQRSNPPPGWRGNLKLSRNIGNAWLESKNGLLLEVPSAILPDVFHTLINPQHPDAHRLNILSVEAVPLDARLK